MIAILTDPGVGGTFLTWTIHYLLGHKKYFSVKNESWIDLPDNPLTGINAHTFKPNQPTSLSEFKQIFNRLESVPDQTIYFHQFFHYETQTAINQVLSADKLIVLALQPSHILYQCRYKSRSPVRPSHMSPSKVIRDADSSYNDVVDKYFRESKAIFDHANLTDIWDKREFIALNFDPFNTKHPYISELVPVGTAQFQLDAMEMWTAFDTHIEELFAYLGASVSQDRLQSWQLIYDKWKLLHIPSINFINNFDIIVNNIVGGIELDLVQFNLDIQQEAAIQRALMHKHSLNLKTWQLTRFTNTMQLHNLLEPCQHVLN